VDPPFSPLFLPFSLPYPARGPHRKRKKEKEQLSISSSFCSSSFLLSLHRGIVEKKVIRRPRRSFPPPLSLSSFSLLVGVWGRARSGKETIHKENLSLPFSPSPFLLFLPFPSHALYSGESKDNRVLRQIREGLSPPFFPFSLSLLANPSFRVLAG